MNKKRTSNTDKSYADKNEPFEEFILADLDLMREDWELGPVSLADVMDDHHTIENQEFIMLTEGSNTFDKPICVTGFNINEQQAKTIDLATTEPLNIDIVTEATSNNHIDSLDIPINEPSSMTIEKVFAEDPFKLKSSTLVQEAITASVHPNDSIKSVMAHYENKHKKLLKISYAALVFSLSTLLAMAFLSTMVYNTEASNAKLNDLVSLLEVDIRTLTSKYESLEMNSKNIAIDPSNNQLIENIIKPIPVPTNNKLIHETAKRIPLKLNPHGSQLKHRSKKQKNELR
jgi:hypothetical protein